MQPIHLLGSLLVCSSLLLPLPACSKRPDPANPSATPDRAMAGTTTGMDLTDLPDPSRSSGNDQLIIVPASQISALDAGSYEYLHTQLQFFDEYLRYDGLDRAASEKGRYEQLKQSLRLQPNQLFVVGKRDAYNNLNFVGDDFWSAINELGINHLRWLKTNPQSAKDPFETTAQYQTRIQAEAASHGHATAGLQFDLLRLEQVMNYLGKRHELLLEDQDARYQRYNADTQQLTLATKPTDSYSSAGNPTSSLTIVVRCDAQQAKAILDHGGFLGFILRYAHGQLSLEHIVIFDNSLNGKPQVLAQLTPVRMIQHLEINNQRRDLTVPINQAFGFSFGLQRYQPTQITH